MHGDRKERTKPRFNISGQLQHTQSVQGFSRGSTEDRGDGEGKEVGGDGECKRNKRRSGRARVPFLANVSPCAGDLRAFTGGGTKYLFRDAIELPLIL